MNQDQIAHAIRNNLPTQKQKYYNFVCKYLSNNITDPFVTDLPLEQVEDLYTERDGVNISLLEQDFKVFVGKKGSGKTTFWRRYSESKKQLHHGALRLGTTIDVLLPEQDWENYLAHRILEVYQKRLLDLSSEIAPFLPDFVRNTQWRNTFHNLYWQVKGRDRSRIKLLPWEDAELPSHSHYASTPDDILSELCHFIIHPVIGYNQRFGEQAEWPYKKIQIFLDLGENLSKKVILDSAKALQQKSSDGSQDELDIKLFIQQKYKDSISDRSFSQIGPVYHFPPWRREELSSLLIARLGAIEREHTLEVRETGIDEDILYQLRQTLRKCDEFKSNRKLQSVFVDKRIASWRDGLPDADNLSDRVDFVIDYLSKFDNYKGENIFVLFLYILSERRESSDQLHQQLSRLANDLASKIQGISHPIDSNWLNIPTNYLKYAARSKFIQTIVNGALRAYTQPTELDAPVHALKLARGLIAACAGCWEDRFPPPLHENQLCEIVDLYWMAENIRKEEEKEEECNDRVPGS